MQTLRFPKLLAHAVAGALLVSSAMSTAFAADAAGASVRVRGTVVSLAGATLKVKSREGAALDIALKDKPVVLAVAKASIADIKPGDYVGIASLPRAEGGDGALEVLIFPPQMNGRGEGSYAWDLKPNSTMTNATVGDAVQSVNGSVVTVRYHGNEKKLSIPQGTPVVTLQPATRDDIKPGTTVFVPAQKGADGTLAAGQVIVGKNGVVPPM